MKKLNIRNKETHLLVLFGLLTLLFISVNLVNNHTPQDNFMFDDKFPTSSAISINIVSPITNEYFNAIAPDFVVELNETADPMWYTIDGGVTNITFTTNTTIHQGNWTARPEGLVTIEFFANDSLGIIWSNSVDVNKDTVNPSIDSIDSPLAGSNHSTLPTYSLSITEVNLDSIWYTLDGGTNNYTGAVSGTIDSTAWSNAGQGAVTIIFYVNDSSGNWDFASVIINKDTLNPSIDSINSPSPGAWFDSLPPSYSLSITEVNLDSIWYTLDAGLNNYTGAVSGTIDSTAWSNAGQGAVTIIFYVNDSVGNKDSSNIIINKDTINPSLDSIDSPSPGEWFDSTPPGYSLSITEVNLDSIWYTLDGGLNNYTGAVSGTINSTAWSNAGQGVVTIIFYVNDSAGNWDSLSVSVNKDSVGPSIDSIDSPLSGVWFDSTPPGYSLSITEVNLDSIWYTLDGGLNNYTGAVSGTIDSTPWNNAGQGAVTITFYVNDSSGNWDSASVIINRDTTNPSIDSIDSPLSGVWFDSTPPGYSLSITEVNLDSIWYTLDGGLNNYTGVASGTINSTAWSNAGQGMVTILFYVNDSAGNWDSMSVSVNKDSIDPSIDSIDSPSPGTWFNSTPPSYSLSITEVNLDSIWYTLDGGLNNYTGAVSGTIDSTAWSNAGQGAVTIIFYANDSVGNFGFNQVNINKDTIAPTINIFSPTGNPTFGAAAPNFIVEIYDDNLDTMWYTIDGGATNFTFITNGTIDPTEWAALGDGPIVVTIIFYANDTFGLVSSDSENFNKNANAPAINIVSPTLASYFGTDAPSFIVEITDADLNTMWYTIDGGATNITFITNGTIDQTEWTAHSDGSVSLIFYANDTWGNLASELILINKDTVAPTVNILSPILNQLLGVSSPNFLVEIDDPILDTMWYTLDGGLTNYTFLTNGTFNQLVWDSVSNGTATINFYANDLAGNEAFDSVIVRVDKITPAITVNLPLDGSIIGTRPFINITVYDTNVDSIWYIVAPYSLIILANNTDQQIPLSIWNALPEGLFTIELFANDTAGNLNNLYTIDLTKDTLAPTVIIVHPLANTTFTNAPQITLTINDATLDTTWYTIVGTNYTFEFTPVLGTNIVNINQAAWNALSNGYVTIIFYANDSLGRISSDSITVNRNVSEPFDLLAFLLTPFGLAIIGGAIAIIVIVIFLKRRKTHKTSDKEVRKIESLWD